MDQQPSGEKQQTDIFIFSLEELDYLKHKGFLDIFGWHHCES